MQYVSKSKKGTLLFVINVDWYFDLHWVDRAKAALEDGYSVHVAMGRTDRAIFQKLALLGIRHHSLVLQRSSLNPFTELITFIQLNKIIRSIRPDIVHSVTIKPNLYSAMICKLRSVPLVMTFPGLGTLKANKKYVHRVVRAVIMHIFKLFRSDNAKLLFENDEDKEFFLSHSAARSDQMVRVFGAGVDERLFRLSKKNAACSGPLKVLFASRLLTSKGFFYVVDACAHLKAMGYDVQLDVAGLFDPTSAEAISENEIIRLNDEGLINWLGKREDMPALIEEADVVALPSIYGEGVPRILIEACFIGRPILTTSLGGCKDICIDGHNGYIVDPQNADSIKRALLKFINRRQLISDFGLQSRKLVEERYSNTAIIAQQLGFYQEARLKK